MGWIDRGCGCVVEGMYGRTSNEETGQETGQDKTRKHQPTQEFGKLARLRRGTRREKHTS
jgi:hypothetical protein